MFHFGIQTDFRRTCEGREAATRSKLGITKEGRGSHGFFIAAFLSDCALVDFDLTRLATFLRLPLHFHLPKSLSAPVLCTFKTLLSYIYTTSFSLLHDIVICDVCVAVPQSPEEPRSRCTLLSRPTPLLFLCHRRRIPARLWAPAQREPLGSR